MAFVPSVLDKMGFLPKSQPFEQRCDRHVFCVGHGADAMNVEGAEEMIEEGLDRFAGVATALMPRAHRDPDFKLPWIILQTMQSAITDQFVRVALDQGHLKPRSRHAEFGFALAVDQTNGIIGSE